jgi:hypothetical protein
MRIGIDLDNTIVSYNRLFPKIARDLNLLSEEVPTSKNEVKRRLLIEPQGDRLWQKLQGKVYGKYMLQADIFPGFHEFLYASKLRGHQVFIVSHKTEFGHFDEERISLREQALKWLKANEIVGTNNLSIDSKNIFFESTREEKIARIRSLKFTHFIDDLYVIFREQTFPQNIEKIWFTPNQNQPQNKSILSLSSWRDITNYLHHPWQEPEILELVRIKFPALAIERVNLKKGRGNSKIYKLISSGKNYVLKIYPDRQHDPRPRLETESKTCQILLARNYPVPKCMGIDRYLGWGIYNWIDGTSIDTIDSSFLTAALDFMRRLKIDSQSRELDLCFQEASEACFCGEEIAKQIEFRKQKLMSVESELLNNFLKKEFSPCFCFFVKRARAHCEALFNTTLSRSLQILSPSDFGTHNALKMSDERIIFFDFEYFGWDDPVKLVSEFYWHPAMEIPKKLKVQWIEACLHLFRDDSGFARRLECYLPLYGLKWCLILLNEFLQQGLDHRLHAGRFSENTDRQNIYTIQLSKARNLLAKIKEKP